MPTLVRDPPPAEFAALLERRRQLGQDRFDEVWDGVLHMNPAPSYEHQRISQQLAVILDPLARAGGLEAVIGGVNIGTADSYRIPDGSLHRPGSGGTFLSTAALALEIVSPDDETWEKLAFYASHHLGHWAGGTGCREEPCISGPRRPPGSPRTPTRSPASGSASRRRKPTAGGGCETSRSARRWTPPTSGSAVMRARISSTSATAFRCRRSSAEASASRQQSCWGSLSPPSGALPAASQTA